jgi:hypothetical protein
MQFISPNMANGRPIRWPRISSLMETPKFHISIEQELRAWCLYAYHVGTDLRRGEHIAPLLACQHWGVPLKLEEAIRSRPESLPPPSSG